MDSWGERLTWFDCNINSYFDKGCWKKCMRQSRKVLWVVLSARSSQKFERMSREAMDICLRVLKESNKSMFDSYSRQEQCVDHIPYYLSDCCMHINFLATTFLEKTVYIIICKFFATLSTRKVQMRKFQDFTSMLPSFQSIFHQFQPKIATQGLCVQDFMTADWKEFFFQSVP